MKSRSLVLVVAALACGIACAQQHTIVFGNKWISRTFAYGPEWHTVRLGKVAVQSDELSITLQGGKTISGADWHIVGEPERTSGGRQARGGSMHVAPNPWALGATLSVHETLGSRASSSREQALTVHLASGKVPGLRAAITYTVGPDDSWMRKNVLLTGPSDLIVTQVDLEPMTLSPAPPDNGGQGMPVLDGNLWFGVEFPASQNELKDGKLSLDHFPGAALGAMGLRLKTAVWGVTKPGQIVQSAFEDYLDTIATKPRDFTHYNSWYDLRQNELTPKRLLATYAAFKRKLLDPYHVKLAAFVIDDGWQDYQSIWKPNPTRYPKGFAPLAKALEAGGTRLGIWMPLSGMNLDIAWGVKHGYEKSSDGNFYCLGGPKYYAAIRKATADRIHGGNLAYYKHDFNMLACAATGHQHLPDQVHGHEVNVDRTIDLLNYERKLQPGIFLNVTSGMWFSPWWLMSADAIWGAFPGDTGYEKTWPQLTPREWDMSFRDAHLFRMYRERPNNLFPISRLMTHGITQGRYNMLGGANEPLREWCDDVVMYFGRGVQMKELYLSPDRMRDDMWKAVGLGLRWSQPRAPIFARTVMIGGDVRKGQAYGYIHWRGDQGIWVMRNPALDETTLAVPIDQTSGYRGDGKWMYAAVTYPYVAPLGAPVLPGHRYEVKLPPRSVVAIEVGTKRWGGSIPAPKFEVQPKADVASADKVWRAKLSIDVSTGKTRNARLYFVLRGAAAGAHKVTGKALGKERAATGKDWQMLCEDIPALPSHLEATLELPQGNAQAFSRPGHVEAWLVCDVAAPKAKLDVSMHNEPWAIADGWRRRSAKVLDYEMKPKQSETHVTDAQIASATEAALHIDVFGSQGGQYAGKYVYLNGTKIGEVPLNTAGAQDQWEERIVPLTAAQRKLLRRENTVVFTDESSDCYKVRNIALAVKLADGKWVESEWNQDVFSSVGGWAYTEGKVFEGGKSPGIEVGFR